MFESKSPIVRRFVRGLEKTDWAKPLLAEWRQCLADCENKPELEGQRLRLLLDWLWDVALPSLASFAASASPNQDWATMCQSRDEQTARAVSRAIAAGVLTLHEEPVSGLVTSTAYAATAAYALTQLQKERYAGEFLAVLTADIARAAARTHGSPTPLQLSELLPKLI